MDRVTVIDAPCGYGKTTWAIEEINRNQDERIIVVTPYLDEIGRIKKSCRKSDGSQRFREPHSFGGTKLEDFNKLLAAGEDVAVTHCTFLNATAETMKHIQSGKYTLIIDEALDVLVHFNKALSVENDVRQSVNTADVKAMLKQRLISVDDDYVVTWTGGEYERGYKYYEAARYAALGRLYCVRKQVMLLAFPPEVFNCFEQIYVLTYMFDGSILRYYFDYFGIDFEKASVIRKGDVWKMIPYDPALDIQFRRECARLIRICDHERLNDSFSGKTVLSKTWFENKATSEMLKTLKNCIGHYFNRYLPDALATRGDIMWTCSKAYVDKLKGKGYTCIRRMTKAEGELPKDQYEALEKELNCFVPCNARATNKYRNRWALAYCYNAFFNPFIKAFLRPKILNWMRMPMRFHV